MPKGMGTTLEEGDPELGMIVEARDFCEKYNQSSWCKPEASHLARHGTMALEDECVLCERNMEGNDSLVRSMAARVGRDEDNARAVDMYHVQKGELVIQQLIKPDHDAARKPLAWMQFIADGTRAPTTTVATKEAKRRYVAAFEVIVAGTTYKEYHERGTGEEQKACEPPLEDSDEDSEHAGSGDGKDQADKEET
jgi:hypothetical protein